MTYHVPLEILPNATEIVSFEHRRNSARQTPMSSCLLLMTGQTCLSDRQEEMTSQGPHQGLVRSSWRALEAADPCLMVCNWKPRLVYLVAQSWSCWQESFCQGLHPTLRWTALQVQAETCLVACNWTCLGHCHQLASPLPVWKPTKQVLLLLTRSKRQRKDYGKYQVA